jgi:hypothetical protein
MQLVITPDKESFAKAEKMLENIPNGISTAGKNAANRTIKFAKTRISTSLSKVVDSTKSGIAKNIYIKKATKSVPAAYLRVKSRGVNLISFHARQTSTGVSSRIKNVSHAFIARGLNNNRLVFIRTGIKKIMSKGRYVGKRREQIKGVVGMSAQELFRKVPGIAQDVYGSLGPEMQKNLEQQVKYLVEKQQPKSE